MLDARARCVAWRRRGHAGRARRGHGLERVEHRGRPGPRHRPDSIGNVIDLTKNIEVGKFDYLEHPEKLTRSPRGRGRSGIGPGRRALPQGAGAHRWPGRHRSRGQGVPASGPPDLSRGSIIGRELAKTLHVYVGDEITLVSPLGDLGPTGVMPRTRKFRVAAIFYSGMYEYDATHAYMTARRSRRSSSQPRRRESARIE